MTRKKHNADDVNPQPAAAKIADVFGRVELVMISVVLYVIGTLCSVTPNNVSVY